MSPSLRVRAALPFALAFLGAGTAASQSPGRPLAIEDYYRVKTVGNPDLSPDGKWVAFTVSHARRSDERQHERSLARADRRLVAGAARQRRRRECDGAGVARRRSSALLRPAVARSRARSCGAGRRSPRRDAGRRTWAADGGGGRGGRGGGRGGGARDDESRRKVDARSVRDTPPPKRETVYESEFAKRHEERFKGVEFDWMDFQRDAAPFPLPNRVDPRRESAAGDLPRAERRRPSEQLTHLGLRPAGANWNHAGTMLAFTADSAYRNENDLRTQRRLDGDADGAVKQAHVEHRLLVRRRAVSRPTATWILTTRSTPTDAVIAKKMDNGGPVDLVVLPRRRRPRGQSHRDVGLSAVGARSGAATASTSTSPAASAARRISSACRRRRQGASR